ncbi:hypothetical protein RRG08_038388 [Elysia crispata]|uniref:Uncharacterized protein n=1 Tax=Elysia crispata TaxID=231223 RepID=A0AAE1DTR0_9GAST|nr:hypothetical protein RRG08_038388 [Elysia crispata]
MDQQGTSAKQVKGEGEGEEKRRASRTGAQRTRNRSGSRSRSSSSSSSSSKSSKSGSGGKKKVANARKSSKPRNKNGQSSLESPYRPGNSSGQKSARGDKSRDENQRANRKPATENGVAKSSGNNNNINNNSNNNNNNSNSNSTTTTTKNNSNSNSKNGDSSKISGRPLTCSARLDRSTIKGYDNSDRNPNRRNLGSSTDQVADQRPVFGPWRAADPERQRLLVERLAPAKPPAPPDPRFNHWKNHFLYYWQIGSEPKPKREGIYSASPRLQRHREVNRTNSDDQRLLTRPKTTSARVGRDKNKNTNSNNNNNMRLDLTNHPFTGSASVDGRHGMAQRGTQSAREYSAGNSPRIVSGLDRRYMGLQAVSNTQMQDIVDRLTKMTSAYNAKFAPNPHVWVDTEPGAHMVKRSNTTVG